ncbi:MAG TPA: hypothetical protein VJN93_04350 [Candidatus Acidoferrum sp.]|nr:hypothetical protein [Candidatus Acidoferrum sp.]
MDDTDPKWRASHPNAKGVTVAAGDAFQSEFQEASGNGAPLADEQRILEKVVSDYNGGTNPGKFAVRDEGDGRFAVVGVAVKNEASQDQSVNPILDTPVTVPVETRDAMTTIDVILRDLSAVSKTQVGPGTMAINALRQSTVTVGGDNLPARDLLSQALSAAKGKLYWHLYYDPDGKTYALNLLQLRKASYDAAGNRTTSLVRK